METLELDIAVALRSFELGVRLSVGAETVALVGPSGAGKTTVLRAIAGLRRPDRGRIALGDRAWFDAAAKVDLPPERRSVGLVFQEYALFPHMTVRANVAFGGASDARVRRAAGARAASRHLADERPGGLSGGERQRVAVARALARDPQVLLLDEPLSALDAHTRAVVRGELQDVLGALALPTLLVTHDFRDAAALADRIGVMVDGRLRQEGTAAELVAHPADAFVASFTGGNLLPGRADGGVEVALDAGGVVRAAEPASGRVGVAVYPWEVGIALQAPGDGLNGLSGTVHGLAPEGSRVRLRIGEVVVERPAEEIERLALEPGTTAWATFPPEAVRIVALRRARSGRRAPLGALDWNRAMERSRHGRTTPSRTITAAEQEGRPKQRAFCVAALQEGEDLSELRELLRTAGVAVVGQAVQHRDKPHPNTYLGPGKVEEVKAAAKAADANVVAVDDELSPRQERNLEGELGLPVIDRTAIILDIFADHANSAEGKLQVELAQLQYNLARMRGLWTHLERLGASASAPGIGTRGPGETQIETDRRLARDRISALKRKLGEVKSSRAVMRAERERAHLPRVALVGYTNAGKSTLLNQLTGATVGVADRLFHTLDPSTRAARLNGRPYLLTDTVGFIRKLPHQLVDAFGATLEETVMADLVLHVVDASVPEVEMDEMLRAVDSVLDEIGAGDRPRLLVLNKADALDEERREELRFAHPDGILVSALAGAGIDELGERVEHAFDETLRSIDLLLPFDEGGRLAELHELAGELERVDTAEGVRVRGRVPVTVAERYARFAVNGSPS